MREAVKSGIQRRDTWTSLIILKLPYDVFALEALNPAQMRQNGQEDTWFMVTI